MVNFVLLSLIRRGGGVNLPSDNVDWREQCGLHWLVSNQVLAKTSELTALNSFLRVNFEGAPSYCLTLTEFFSFYENDRTVRGLSFKRNCVLHRWESFLSSCTGAQESAILFSLFRIDWLCVTYCLVFCIGSCVPVHEERTVEK